jgi:hypothetical protein
LDAAQSMAHAAISRVVTMSKAMNYLQKGASTRLIFRDEAMACE